MLRGALALQAGLLDALNGSRHRASDIGDPWRGAGELRQGSGAQAANMPMPATIAALALTRFGVGRPSTRSFEAVLALEDPSDADALQSRQSYSEHGSMPAEALASRRGCPNDSSRTNSDALYNRGSCCRIEAPPRRLQASSGELGDQAAHRYEFAGWRYRTRDLRLGPHRNHRGANWGGSYCATKSMRSRSP